MVGVGVATAVPFLTGVVDTTGKAVVMVHGQLVMVKVVGAVTV